MGMKTFHIGYNPIDSCVFKLFNNSLKKKSIACIKNDYSYKFKSFSETETTGNNFGIDTIKSLCLKNFEPVWVFNFRLDSLKHLYYMKIPKWSDCLIDDINLKDLTYYSALLKNSSEITKNTEIENKESKTPVGTAVDLVIDSVSISTSYQKELFKNGIIFSNLSKSIQLYPDLVSCYLGSVVSIRDNYYTCLNSAVFSEGTFVYIPKNTVCPMDLSTYFRINGSIIGQFERTLIITESNSKVSYLEGCTAPFYSSNQLHAAVVELYASANSEIKYSTVQNWFPGDSNGIGGIYNFVTKRGLCEGKKSKISWTQVETGSSITWKYPSVVLKGDSSLGEFYSIAVTRLRQQADTGSKMIHIGANTRSKIISKGISLENSFNSYRGMVYVHNNSLKSKNMTQCDSIILGNSSYANTYPYIIIKDSSASLEHEASIAKIKDDQLFYLQQRCISYDEAVNLIVGGFCKEVIQELPFEFLTEVNELLNSTILTKVG